MDKVNKETLVKYLMDNVAIENSLIHTDDSISVRLEGFTFKLSLHRISYERHDVSDSVDFENDELDELIDTIRNFYTKQDLNNELITLIRNNNIEDITD